MTLRRRMQQMTQGTALWKMDESWTDPRFCKDGDSSDDECIPFLQLRVGGAASKVGNIEQLPEISMDETVLDVAVPNPTDDQMTDATDHLKPILTELLG
ncbi:hypothetical protein F2P81_025563 [Scophthalmus maximus]|uniref:Uncharacterized protein n=1 Tax=Scophthalmus maximus TaxID=52904 RepID=A0A6A4RUF5_SCOMX|nr:hypothetical protein F2P81_025563 [Scophthalmus maximus]